MRLVLPLLIPLLLAACSREQRSLEDLLAAGHGELQRGDLRVARAHAEEGRGRAHEMRDPPWERRFQVLLAEVLLSERRNAEALALLGDEDGRDEPPDPVEARALVTRAYARCLSGGAESFRRSEADLEQAGRLAAALQSAELASEVTLRRGTCALIRGDFQAAETHFREAFAGAHRGQQAFLEATAAASLGFLRVRTGLYDDGADWNKRALDLASALKADLVLVKVLGNLAWCYIELGDYDQALTLLARAEPLAEARGHSGDRLIALQSIGNIHYKLRDFETAGDYYRRAVDIAKELGDHRRLAELLSNLGIVALEQGRFDDAEPYVRQALTLKAESKDLAATQHSLQAEGQIWEGRGDYGKAETFYRSVLASPHSSRELLWEARASLASLRLKTKQRAEAEVEFRRAFAIMEESRGELRRPEHKISFFSSLVKFYDRYVDFLIDDGRARQALEVAGRSRARLLRERVGAGNGLVDAPDRRPEGIARALDAVVLFYWLAPRRSWLWVVTPRTVQLRPLPGEGEIQRHVEAHQALVLKSRDPLSDSTEAEWLYRTLVAPAGAFIPPGSRVVMIPDGPLHQINPETLVVPSPKPHYWIEDVTLATAPSLALPTEARRRVRPERHALIIGDPIPVGDEFPRLPHAMREVEQVAEQFSPSERTVYTGARAEPSAYATAVPGRFSIIHFAAHAKANPLIPLDSAVILSPKNDTYKLYAREIVDRRLNLNADLVTLSACRSAGSRTYAGEGQVGLAWAFLSAGAGNVVAGLWNVEDASTAELMEELYRGLEGGLAPAEALRAAKLRLLRSDTAWRKPFYWAPFMIYTQRPAAGRAS